VSHFQLKHQWDTGNLLIYKLFGAVKRTRTSTPVKELAPQASASTSSAMTALIRSASCGRKAKAVV
jgi:hypothetical protein